MFSLQGKDSGADVSKQICYTILACFVLAMHDVCVCAGMCQLVSIAVETITLQSLEGTRTLFQMDAAASDYTPVLHAQICNQVVLQVSNHQTSILCAVLENTTCVITITIVCQF